MGYVEMIKVTDNGRIAVILDGGEIRHERAFQCDTCHRYRPESKLMTHFFNGDDFILECNECRQ